MIPPSWLAATKKRTFAVDAAETCAWTASVTARMPATPTLLCSTNHTEPTCSAWMAWISSGPSWLPASPSRKSWPTIWSSLMVASTWPAHDSGEVGVRVETTGGPGEAVQATHETISATRVAPSRERDGFRSGIEEVDPGSDGPGPPRHRPPLD